MGCHQSKYETKCPFPGHNPGGHTPFFFIVGHVPGGHQPRVLTLWPQSTWWLVGFLATGIPARARGPHWRQRGEAAAAGAVQQAGGGRLHPLRQGRRRLPVRPAAGLPVLPASARPPARWVAAVTAPLPGQPLCAKGTSSSCRPVGARFHTGQ